MRRILLSWAFFRLISICPFCVKKMKNLSINSYPFESMIRGGFLYVDKTEYIYSPETGKLSDWQEETVSK